LLWRISFVLSVLTLGGCFVGMERPERPAISAQAGFSTRLPLTHAEPEPASTWWRSAVPEGLWLPLEQAVAVDPTLRRAQAQTTAALARWRQAEANTGLDLSLGAGADIQTVSGDRTDSQSIDVDARLPIDANGALGLRVDTARNIWIATGADAEQLRSDLARDFLIAQLDGAEANQRHALLLRQIELAETLLRLIELRFTQGLSSSVDVLQQRDQVASLRQELPQARLDQQQAANRLRRISARTPEQASPLVVEPLPEVSGIFASVEPIDLLSRRAALRASGARLEAADAGFAAALADRWPTLQLSALSVSRALSGDVTTLLAGALDAAVTLFDSGNLEAVATERRAQLVAAGQEYLADWLDAVIEVDDLIHQEASLRERIVLSEQRLENAEALLKASQRRYEQGVSDYLPVLAALRGMQQQQRDQLALLAELARSRVRLHRALGHPMAADAT